MWGTRLAVIRSEVDMEDQDRTTAEDVFNRVNEAVSDGASEVKSAASRMAGEPIRKFARATAERVSEGADYVRGQDFESIISDLEGAVRKYPAAALLIATGVGVVMGRAMRARS